MKNVYIIHLAKRSLRFTEKDWFDENCYMLYQLFDGDYLVNLMCLQTDINKELKKLEQKSKLSNRK